MQIDRDAPLRFLRTAFLPDDWIAVLLKSHDTSEVVQRVGPVSIMAATRFQSWLRFKNARRFSVFLSVNAITPGLRSRTRESIGAVRHVFIDADHGAGHVLSAIAARPDLPPPSYIVRSSKDRAHLLWRVRGFGIQGVEALQKHLARELGTDMAATSAAQMTRLSGFFNHKYDPSELVTVDYVSTIPVFGGPDFPNRQVSPSPPTIMPAPPASTALAIKRARLYLAATPPAVAGKGGDAHTFGLCCRLFRHFQLNEHDLILVLTEWNQGCDPPWTEEELIGKVKRARRQP